MSSVWKYKASALLLVVFFAIYTLVPTFLSMKENKADLLKAGKSLPWYYQILPDKELNLGLDLRGGLYMELDVGIADALEHQINSMANDIRRLILTDTIKDAEVRQIMNNRLRVEVALDQQSEFKQELVIYFGNDIFNIESKVFELIYKIKGDAMEARKKAFEAVEKLDGFKGAINIIGQNKFIAVSYVDEVDKQVIKSVFDQAAYFSFFEDQTDLYKDVLYLTVSDVHVAYLKKNIIEQASNSVRNRIDRFGVAEASVSRQSSDRLIVELPGVKDPDRIIDIIKRTGKLEFRLTDETLGQKELQDLVVAQKEKLKLTKLYEQSALEQINAALEADLPPETEVAFQVRRNPETQKITRVIPYLVQKNASVTGDMLDNASVQVQNNMPYVSMAFNKVGAQKFGDLTSQNVGRYLAIVLDGVITSAPVIKSAITGGQAQIELGYGRYEDLQREAQELVLILKEGALPASLKVATKNIIGPSLGKDSIDAGLNSLMIAALAVLIFMLVYYKVSGLIANLALLVNLLMIFGILTLFQASLTLPGIAGIVLTMGMAVDANVIIFERMREEKYLGHKAAQIIDSGYGNAMSAILDGNITTFISALVLFEFGTGPIKGFATTLMIGIVTTLITAIVLTRVMYDWLVHGMRVKEIRI